MPGRSELKRRNANGEELSLVLDSIRAIVRELRLASREAEQELGLSGAQLFILQTLGETSELSINDLADRTFTHQSSVSMVVSRLVDARLVVRKTTTDDARKASVSLTSAGRAMLGRAPDAGQTRLIRALRSMTPAKLSALAEHVAEVADLLEISSREPGQARGAR